MSAPLATVRGALAMGTMLFVLTAADFHQPMPPDPFGGETVIVDDGELAAIWRHEIARMTADDEAIKACAGDPLPDCAAALRLMAIVAEARTYQGHALVGHVNRAINLLLRPTPGAWLSPLEALRLGNGDCKDYSLAKYFALRQAGVPTERLRLVIVRNLRRSEDHMVVAVYDGGWLILDNLTMVMVTDIDDAHVYAPLFVLDHAGTRRYVPVGS